ncbi:MAG: 7-cyano-7-deazaguanine synthase [Dysgonamonadaceae bacterium]|nr:7-cyano-7-deazaguanine synthase [Dysgonamonadaceae bacterium]
MKIKVATPIYDSSTKTVTVKLKSEEASATIKIGFQPLIPFANKVSSVVVDFFVLSACAYGIDRFIERKSNSIDGWSRELTVELPVSDANKWLEAKNEWDSLLSFLTGDYWNVCFYKTKFEYPQRELPKKLDDSFSQVNLFSGGLDSLIGAIDFLENKPNERLLLTSHYDQELSAKTEQKKLLQKLEMKYKGQYVHIDSVNVTLSDSTKEKETTFRSRSILFIGIASLVAQTKSVPIVVPENGSVSLNYPLSPSRRSACSTRTTHPTFIAKLRELWNKVGISTNISNPYEFSTKGEMVLNCNNIDFLKSIIEISNSCGKRGHRVNWENKSATHCGICMPCTYRRAALLSINDKTTYGNTINKKYAGRKKIAPFLLTRQGQDIGACLEFLKTELTREDIKDELLVGGVTDLSKINNYVDVVLRTRAELVRYIIKFGDDTTKKKAGLL